MPFPRELVQSEMIKTFSKIWTHVASSISYNNNCLIKCTWECLCSVYLCWEWDVPKVLLCFEKSTRRAYLLYSSSFFFYLLFFFFIISFSFSVMNYDLKHLKFLEINPLFYFRLDQIKTKRWNLLVHVISYNVLENLHIFLLKSSGKKSS